MRCPLHCCFHLFRYADTTIAVGDIWSGVVPYIVAAIGAVITFLVGWVLNLLKTKLGVSIDDSVRASVQTAATNAAGLVLNQLGNSLQDKKIDVGNQFVADAVNYVLKPSPDAVKHFGLTPDAIAQKILALLLRSPLRPPLQTHRARNLATLTTWLASQGASLLLEVAGSVPIERWG